MCYLVIYTKQCNNTLNNVYHILYAMLCNDMQCIIYTIQYILHII